MKYDSIEIELLNGKRMLLQNDWKKVYNICEKTKKIFKFLPKFPFIKIEKIKYVSFNFMTHYEAMQSISDPKYNVKCSLQQFASLFDVTIVPFEYGLIAGDFKKHAV